MVPGYTLGEGVCQVLWHWTEEVLWSEISGIMFLFPLAATPSVGIQVWSQ